MTKWGEFLQEPDGAYSSKRLVALVSFVVAATLAFMGRDLPTVALFMGVTTTILGIQAVTHT